jgi:hypothetical protein
LFVKLLCGYMREDRRDVYYMVREQVLTLTNGAGNLEDGKIHSGKHGTYGAA